MCYYLFYPATVIYVSPSKKPTLVLLVRHGRTPTTGIELYGRKPGVHLSEEGKNQATEVSERIGKISSTTIAAVYASPLERTRETAAPIAKAVGQKVKKVSGLLELDVGEWTGKKLSELRKLKAWDKVTEKLEKEDPFFKEVNDSAKAWAKKVAYYSFFNEADFKLGYEHIFKVKLPS